MAKILLIDDDLTFAQMLQNFLQKRGHEVTYSSSAHNGLKFLEHSAFDLLLLDYRLPDGTGLDVLTRTRKSGSVTPAIIMTSFNDVRTAVHSMRSGAFDYITKPVNPDELLMVMGDALNAGKTAAPDHTDGFIRGKSTIAAKLDEYVSLIAPTDMSVVIQGESGTGKEYAARIIHSLSTRSSKPFVAIDCGALSKELAGSELFGHVKGAFTGAIADKKGVFEQADGGTLFLDEIGNLSYDIQVKLLRALQEKVIQPVGGSRTRPVDIRLISATNEDLAAAAARGDFRQDLYHRINEFKIQLPPLRQRGNDIDIFTAHFISQANAELGRHVESISPDAQQLLHRYDWPGNLRELRNVIRRMVLLTPDSEAQADALPDEMHLSLPAQPVFADSDLKARNEANEKELIQKTLQEVNFNKSKAARLLNIDRKTLYAKLERYGIDH